LRTSVPAVDQPSTEGRFGARLRESEEASRLQLQTRPALVQEKQISTGGILTPIEHCATITFGRKFGTGLTRWCGLLPWIRLWWQCGDLTSSRVEEIHKTSRNRMGGQGKRVRMTVVTPAVAPNELWRGVPLLALETGLAWRHGLT
jgi:hypothetical protein